MNTEKLKYSGIISLTQGADRLGQNVYQCLNKALPDLNLKHFDSEAVKSEGGMRQLLEGEFHQGSHWIFIGAVGIMVRAMAPLLKDKFQDPAVIAMDEAGQFVISLLSGHAGGANELARTLSVLMGAQAVITTATDVLGVASLDLVLQKLHVRLKDHRNLILRGNAALARGEVIGLWVDEAYLEKMGEAIVDWQPRVPGLSLYQDRASLLDANLGLKIYVGVNPITIKTLSDTGVEVVIPRAFYLGTGAKKQLPKEQYIAVLRQWLEEQGICPEAIQGVASIDLKSSEACILEAASQFGWETRFYSAVELMPYEDDFEPSAWVKETTGVASVSGPAVLKALKGKREGLMHQQYKGSGCTFTLGRIYHD